MYEITDQKMKQLITKIRKLYSRSKATIGIDALNIIEESKELYDELASLNENAYLDIAKKSYDERIDEVNSFIPLLPTVEKEEPNKAWILALLLLYDPVTKYVYRHEVERKRARFAESVIASSTKSKEYTTAQNLWLRQTGQYAITIEDAAAMKAYKDVGVKKVKWVTEKDGHVCSVCAAREGKIYPISKAPSKTHYGCRCYYIPVK